ncbi:hypothetical protein MLD38_000462 [Melastoma candidum]|uniref:Uncharacterized protein n=1 Tax=Melastoma candidum TaxID=119954 RepID=A0ACB9SB38_9MYRT|nr:hypothetical protein MLD38_000462 [Melastoma candidum]
MAATARLHHHVTVEPAGPDGVITSLPLDREVVVEEGWIENGKICITRQCSLLVDRHDLSRLQGDLESLHQRLFEGGSPIRRPGLTYSINCDLIVQSIQEITQMVYRELSDKQNVRIRNLSVDVVSVHIISLPEDLDEGDDEYDEEEAWMIEEEEFVARPASQEAVASLGRTKIEGGDCAVCLEELSPLAEHISMPCCHIFHKECIIKWLEMRHSCPLCRFSLPLAGSRQS